MAQLFKDSNEAGAEVRSLGQSTQQRDTPAFAPTRATAITPPQDEPAPAPVPTPQDYFQALGDRFSQLTASGQADQEPSPENFFGSLADKYMGAQQAPVQARAEPGIASDVGNLLGLGVNNLALSVRELVGRIPGVGKSIVDGLDSIDKWATGTSSEQLLQNNVTQGRTALSTATREAQDKEWWDSDKGTFGSAWLDPRSYMAGVFQSLPEQAVTMFPVMRLAKGVYAARVAAGAAPEAAAAAAARAATVAGGVSEGLLAGAGSSREVRDKIMRMTPEQLGQSDAVRMMVESGMDFETARATLAEDAATQAFILSGTVTGAFGGLGDRFLAKAITSGVGKTVMGRTAKGFVTEGLEEFPQEYGSAVAENYAMQSADPNVQLTEGALNQGLGGLAIGGLQGGAVTAAFGKKDEQSRKRTAISSDGPVTVSYPVDEKGDPVRDAELDKRNAELGTAVDAYLAPSEDGTVPPSLDPALDTAEGAANYLQRIIDQAPAQDADGLRDLLISRVIEDIEARDGVASPDEAAFLEAQGMGRPYDSIDTSIPSQRTPSESPSGIVVPDMPYSARPSDPGIDPDAVAAQERQDAIRAEKQAAEAARVKSAIAATSQAPVAPDIDATIAALKVTPALRTTEQRLTVSQAQSRFEPEDLELIQRQALNGALITAPERVRLQELRRATVAPAPVQAAEPTVEPVRAERRSSEPVDLSLPAPVQPTRQVATPDQRIAAAAAQGRLAQQPKGMILTSDAKLSTRRRPVPGSTLSIKDGGTDHMLNVVPNSKMGVRGKLLEQIGRIFGKRLVSFQSDTLQADGFVLNDDNQNIYVNINSEVSPLAVFGHELLHQLKRDNPQAYIALEAVIRRNIKESAEMDAEYAGYDADARTEEVTADLVGNRFQDPNFWADVFGEIEALYPTESRGIIAKLRDALVKAVAAFKAAVGQSGYKADNFVKDLDGVTKAIQDTFVQYAQDQRISAQQMEAGLTPGSSVGDNISTTNIGSPNAKFTNARANGREPEISGRDRSAPGSDRSGQADLPAYGTPREGAVSAVGRHYSPVARESLNGDFYGTGMRGAERRRLDNALDQRIRNRVYFYVDNGNGITPESGVGNVAHEVRLNNLYDPFSGLIPTKPDANQFESAVIDAGFDGYIAKNFGQMDAVVLLGPKHKAVPVKLVGQPTPVSIGQAEEVPEAQFSASRRGSAQQIGDFQGRLQKDGSLAILGDPSAIRAMIPSDVIGRPINGGILFTNAAAPRVRAALEGRQVAYSRAGEVVDKLPMKNGKYIGAPEKFNTPGKITKLRQMLRTLADEGAPGRFWYENSGREVLKMVGGDVNEARRFVALLAIYSPQAKVDANSTFALRAWAQYKAGQPISVKTGSQDKKAIEALRDVDAFWKGEKTGNFFFNLLREIDPSTQGKQGATIDMWMMRAGQYSNDAPTSTQYAFMENETNRIARELGWEPQQVQAAIWVAMKARMENAGVKKKTEASSEKNGWIRFENRVDPETGKSKKTRVIIDAQKHRDNWLKFAFEHDVSQDDTQQAKFDFGDGLKRHVGQVSFEARPGRTTGVLPGIHNAPYAQQVEFQKAVQAAFLDENGNDRLAQMLGLLVDTTDITLPGVWQGEVSPSSQKLLAMAPAKGDDGKKKVDPAQALALNAYAAAHGLVTKQEGVGWHRPFYAGTKRDANALDIDIGRAINPQEAKDLSTALDTWMQDNGFVDWNNKFAIISSPNGVRLVNFGVVSNEQMQSAIKDVAEDALPDFNYRVFASDGDMPTNDWKENPDGQSYVQRISAAGRPDVLGWVRDVLAPRVESVFQDFSKRYDWGDPGSVKFSRNRSGSQGTGSAQDRSVQTPERAAPQEALKALPGAPEIQGFTGPDPRLVSVAERYARDNGITLKRQAEYVDIDPDRATRIAQAYADMPHDPQNPVVKEAYENLIRQVTEQYRALEADGYQFWFIDMNNPPNVKYASSPWNALRDIRANKQMGVFPTVEGFGSDANFDATDSPLMADTGITWPVGSLGGERKPVLANDLFRAVHDAFGHGLEGAGFRARGEENAWQAHVRLFTGSAIGAMTSETRGQNSWLNYGPNGEANRTAKIEDTVFADQKTGLMPEWTYSEGITGDFNTDPSAADENIKFSLRRKPAPEKTVTAYKLFRVDARKPGQLFPLFVNANDPVEIGTWLDADIGEQNDKGKVKSKLGPLAFRPGWHAGDVPVATHIGSKSDTSLTAPDTRSENHVWAEVEMAADRDWQTEATARARRNKDGEIILNTAHITDQIPEDGFYRYKTNANMTGNWLIGGSMKVNRILSDTEVEQINAAAGTADLPRAQPFDAAKYGFDTQFSRRRPTVKENIYGDPVLSNWTAPEMGKWDGKIRYMQDKQIDTKRVIKAINDEVGQIEDKFDVYLKEELFYGRAATQTKEFLAKEVKPLLEDMDKRGVKPGDLETYLHNRHAETRNNVIAARTPSMPDGGSGIMTADAQAYLAALSPQERANYEALAKRVDAITKGTREFLVASGVETRESIALWEQQFPDYVPLFRAEGDYNPRSSNMGTGSGFSVQGASSKKAKGSTAEVTDILANIMQQRERAIVRGEKTRVGRALFGLAVTNPNPDFWLAVKPGARNDADLDQKLIALGLDPADARNLMAAPDAGRDYAMAVRIDGEDHFVFFNNTNERAKAMVESLKNINADQLGRVLGSLGKFTRYFANINTQYNPIFGMINLIRDTGSGLLNLTTTGINDKKAQVLSDIVPAMKGIYGYLRETRQGNAAPQNEWAKLWQQFTEIGGQTGYRDQYSNSEQRADALATELKRLQEGKPIKSARAVFDWLSDYNETLENAVRLSSFKAALDKGMTPERAASIAKNLTVNFNRKGEVATQAGALYAFFNASMQGTARLYETLTGPAGKKILAGGFLLGTMQALALSLAGYEEDEPPDFVKERNFIIPLGFLSDDLKTKYVTIPLPLGFNVIPNAGRVVTEWALQGFKDPSKRVLQIAGSLLETFNPIGNSGWSAQTIAPTIADPIIALTENRDFTGKPIYRKNMSDLDPEPGYLRARDSANAVTVAFSKFLNQISGGTDFKPGNIDVTPDAIEYLIGQATGGVGRELMKIAQTGQNLVTGEETEPYKVPIAGRFFGDTASKASTTARFYSNVTELNKHLNEIEGRRKSGQEVSSYIQENPEATMSQAVRRYTKTIGDLKKARDRVEEQGGSRDAIKYYDNRITEVMQQLNDRVKELKK